MGIVHLAPVGINPGAVTAALAYLLHNEDQFCYYKEKGDVVESVALFVSHDVMSGQTPLEEAVFNRYGEYGARHTWKRKDRANVVDAVLRFIEKEIAPAMPSRAKVYGFELNPNDFESCFDVLADAVLALGRADATGKHLWANLTGGTNILNAALFEAAALSGLIARAYYTFVPSEADRKYLQPPARDPARFAWKWVPLTKTAFDAHYYRVLETLQTLQDWCRDEDLLDFVKGDVGGGDYFAEMALADFCAQFLNRMDRHELERDGQSVRLSAEGARILDRIESVRFQALVRRGHGIDEPEQARLKRFLKECELWSK